ncbi:MAG: glycosyltransferase family 4 protein [Ginsengibacter sp.]
MANVLCLVSYKIFPAQLGGQKGVALFYKYLSRFHNVTCVTVKGNDPGFATYPVLNVLSNSPSRYLNILYFFTLRKIIREHKISCLILEHPYYGWLGILLKMFCGVKLVIHSHNIESHRFKTIGKWWWRILWSYEKFVHGHADLTFCITEEDRQYMIREFKIQPAFCSVITYGIEWTSAPAKTERSAARTYLRNQYNLDEGTFVYLFNGTLDYQPNLVAVKNILDKVNPYLLSTGIRYKIIICGKNLPEVMNELKSYASRNIIYAGFVDDISLYFKGADVFINPVSDGGGIKTKLVEALGYDLPAVSTVNGAIGVDPSLCNGKLLLSGNSEWQDFTENMKNAILIKEEIPGKYFDHFSWTNISAKAAGEITGISTITH